ncbi:hypothetical protein PAXRUDRAFT_480279 [Paxillus rubicundulus Ve08.2h10]|uniref:Uncharacterized protein n=1 Tax=Paxillus rubicundulus Ve08.2h10 TaxID=930991 RepID=A0A0D0DW62_9AGAM|nr:hypothetical protein PAXRUDRAFT_480279 [Paxillus rubicundulus Ve08.2h10]
MVWRFDFIELFESQVCKLFVSVYGGRALLLPDNHRTHALPPDMGAFKLFHVGEASATLGSVLAKGGAFISMCQREAMWVSFGNWGGHLGLAAVRISVGVNPLTGLPQRASAKGKQNYLPIGGKISSCEPVPILPQ